MSNDNLDKRLEEAKAAIQKERQIFHIEQELKNMKANSTRARSVTVGTAFGGITEVSMRGDGDNFLWCILQPVEVTELIHQLASNIGCHINIQPRKDFASWREWRDPTPDERLGLNGWAPPPNDLALHAETGAKLPPPEHQPGLNITDKTRNEDEPLAITKTSNKRKSKRASTST